MLWRCLITPAFLTMWQFSSAPSFCTSQIFKYFGKYIKPDKVNAKIKNEIGNKKHKSTLMLPFSTQGNTT